MRRLMVILFTPREQRRDELQTAPGTSCRSDRAQVAVRRHEGRRIQRLVLQRVRDRAE